MLAALGASAGLVFAASENPSTTTTTTPVAKKAAGKTTTVRFDSPIPTSLSDLFIEINGTDGDAGLQAFIDADGWKRAIVLDPGGRKLLDFRGVGRMAGWGLNELSFESVEPGFDEVPFAKFKSRSPAGKYRIRGRNLDNELIIGSARLTHVVPKAPRVVSPTPNAVVPTPDLTIQWEPVTAPWRVRIVGYEVLCSDDVGESASFELPPTPTSLTLPAELLARASEHKIAALAREKSGSGTITEAPLRHVGCRSSALCLTRDGVPSGRFSGRATSKACPTHTPQVNLSRTSSNFRGLGTFLFEPLDVPSGHIQPRATANHQRGLRFVS